jgi:XTP/dITP diphosphohydrolase
MNVVMTGSGKFVEVQGTAEGAPFDRAELDALLELGQKKDAAANLELLLDQLRDIADPHRAAHFTSTIALVLTDGREHVVEGRWPGRLAQAASGVGGFGYDPIFLPDGQPSGQERSVGEFTADEKQAQSHRARAFAELVPLLAGL